MKPVPHVGSMLRSITTITSRSLGSRVSTVTETNHAHHVTACTNKAVEADVPPFIVNNNVTPVTRRRATAPSATAVSRATPSATFVAQDLLWQDIMHFFLVLDVTGQRRISRGLIK